MTTVVNHLIYEAFGRVTSESNPAVDSLFLFTGRPFDSDTGLQNNLNRWYDPTVGCWLSEDPIGFAGGDRNLCRYVGNRVLTETDFSGLQGSVPDNPCPCGEALTQIWAVGPFNARIADSLRHEALRVTLDVALQLPNGMKGVHNGPADAFRHCYWSCRMTQRLGSHVAKTIADIHAYCARHVQPVAEEAMDQFNNEVGRNLARDIGHTADCRRACKEAVWQGSLQLFPGGDRPVNSYPDKYPL